MVGNAAAVERISNIAADEGPALNDNDLSARVSERSRNRGAGYATANNDIVCDRNGTDHPATLLPYWSQ